MMKKHGLFGRLCAFVTAVALVLSMLSMGVFAAVSGADLALMVSSTINANYEAVTTSSGIITYELLKGDFFGGGELSHFDTHSGTQEIGVASDFVFIRAWQMAARYGTDTVIKVTAHQNAKVKIDQRSDNAGSSWATNAAFYYVTENASGDRVTVKEIPVTGANMTQDNFDTDIHLAAGDSVYIIYKYTGTNTNGYGVAEFSPLIEADTDAYDASLRTKYPVSGTWDQAYLVSQEVAAEGAPVSAFSGALEYVMLKGDFFSGSELSQFTTFTSTAKGDGANCVGDSTEAARMWPWQVKCTNGADFIVKFTAKRDMMLSLWQFSDTANNWATSTAFYYVTENAYGIRRTVKEIPVTSGTMSQDLYAAELHLAAGDSAYFIYHYTGTNAAGNGTSPSNLRVSVDTAAYDASKRTQYPDPQTCEHSYSTEILTPAGIFTDGEAKKTCSICGYSCTETIPATKTVKILMIGNSASDNSSYYLWQILNDLGVETVVVGNAQIGGTSLDDHWNRISDGSAAYTYRKTTDGTWVYSTDTVTLEHAVTDEAWDIITVNNRIGYSGLEDKFANLDNIINWLEETKTNSSAKILYMMPWACPEDSGYADFPLYNNDQVTMYEAIAGVTQTLVEPNAGIDGILPVGTAIQNARTSSVGDNLDEDGIHLNPFGKYIAGLTIACVILDVAPEQITWAPEGIPQDCVNVAVEAATNAIAKPYEVTQSKITGQIELPELVVNAGADLAALVKKAYESVETKILAIQNTIQYEMLQGDFFGSGALTDLAKTGEKIMGDDQKFVFIRAWDFAGRYGTDAILKITAQTDMKLSITQRTDTAGSSWALNGAYYYVTENAEGTRITVKEIPITGANMSAELFNTSVHLAAGDTLYILYHYTGTNTAGYGVANFSPLIEVSTTAYDESQRAVYPKTQEQLSGSDMVSAEVKANGAAVETDTVTYQYLFGDFASGALSAFTAFGGDGSGSYLDVVGDENSNNAVWRWQWRCDDVNDTVLKITAKSDLKLDLSHPEALSAQWATHSTFTVYAANASGKVVKIASYPVQESMDNAAIAATVHLAAGESVYIVYSVNDGASGQVTAGFIPVFHTDIKAYDADQRPDYTYVDPATCEHSYKATVITPATTFAEGLQEQKCEHCKTAYTETIPATNSIKILLVGNSHTMNTCEYLWEILKDLGVETVIIGNANIGGTLMDTHWNNMVNDAPNYNYYKNTDGTWVLTPNTKVSEALADEDWDIITFQQRGYEAGVADAYGNLGNVLDYLNENKTNPYAKIYWPMTWAFQANCVNESFEAYYNSDQMTMYNAIVDVMQNVVEPQELVADVIPMGTALQNARTSALGDTLMSDGVHANSMGCYIVGLTFAGKVLGIDVDGITWAPEGLSQDCIDIAVESATNAIANPYEVTPSGITGEIDMPDTIQILLHSSMVSSEVKNKGAQITDGVIQYQYLFGDFASGRLSAFTVFGGEGNGEANDVVGDENSDNAVWRWQWRAGDSGQTVLKLTATEDLKLVLSHPEIIPEENIWAFHSSFALYTADAEGNLVLLATYPVTKPMDTQAISATVHMAKGDSLYIVYSLNEGASGQVTSGLIPMFTVNQDAFDASLRADFSAGDSGEEQPDTGKDYLEHPYMVSLAVAAGGGVVSRELVEFQYLFGDFAAGTLSPFTAFTGTGSENFDDVVGDPEGPNAIWRWQWRFGTKNTVLKMTAKADVKIDLSSLAVTDTQWALGSAYRIYAENADGVRVLLKSIEVKETMDTADANLTVHLAEGEKLYIVYGNSYGQYSDDATATSGYMPVFTVDAAAYDAAEAPDYTAGVPGTGDCALPLLAGAAMVLSLLACCAFVLKTRRGDA